MNRHLFKLFGKYDTQLGYIKGSSSTVVKFGYWIEENFPVKVYHFKPLYQDHNAR